MEDDDQQGSAVRKLIVAEYMSLDGVVQAPGHADEDRRPGGHVAPRGRQDDQRWAGHRDLRASRRRARLSRRTGRHSTATAPPGRSWAAAVLNERWRTAMDASVDRAADRDRLPAQALP